MVAIAGAATIRWAATGYTEQRLNQIGQRVADSIKFDQEKWDISNYILDETTPGAYRLYIFANDGFVVERWRPISGYLNIANFRNLMRYEQPRTVETITNQKWRIYSKPITEGGDHVGVVTVASLNPDGSSLDLLDKTLHENAAKIIEQLQVNDGKIATTNLNPAQISPNITFQVVNKYDRILAKTNSRKSLDSIPDFISTSYVQRSLDTRLAKISDNETGEPFLVSSRPIIDQNGQNRGVVIVAGPVAYLNHILAKYILVNVILGAALLISLILAGLLKNKKSGREQQSSQTNRTHEPINEIRFDKKECLLKINGRDIQLTYATNQYYLCVALFSARKKAWETDELIEKFGEPLDNNSWRKVYDAVANVNKKAATAMEQKLVVVNNKTYRLNPDLLDKIR